jgi:protein TonB
MTILRWMLLIILSGILNAAIFVVVPLASALLVKPPKHEYKTGTTSTQVDINPKIRPHDTQKKIIRQMSRTSKSFKPSRAMAGGPARGFQMDLSLASGGEGSGGVGVGTGNGGPFGALGGGGPGAEVFDPSEVDQAARVIKEVEVAYPARAKREGVTGYAKFYLVIDARGQVADLQLLSVDPAGYGFEIEAEKAVRQYRFEPARIKDVPVAQKFTKEFVFDQGY